MPTPRFQLLIEQLNEIVFIINEHGCFTFLNPAWQTRTGYSNSECLGQAIQNFIHPDDLGLCQTYFSGQQSHCFDIRILDKNHNILWFEASIMPIPDNQGELGIMGTFVDITGRVKAAQDLKANKERFQLAATASNDGIWDWNLLTNEVYFSPRWKEMLGYTDTELENAYSTWYNLVHPDDLPETLADLSACIEGKNNLYENVHRLKHKNGSWRWILDRGIVMRDASGQPLRMAGSHADITRLKQIEEELLHQKNELNNIFSMSPDGIVTFTKAGNISSVSPMFLKMTGFSSDELIHISEAEFIEKMAAISFIDLPKAFNDEQTCVLIKISPCNHLKLPLPDDLKTDGNFKVLKLTVSGLDNQAISKVMYFRDVTIETEVDRLKSEFLSTAAHELRTPMSSVYGFTELLLTRDFEKSTKREILSNIHQQTANLVRMVNDLLDLAKIEARMDKEFIFSEQSLEAVINQTLQEFMPYEKGPGILAEFSDNCNLVYIDSEQVKRALTNILSNAYKYSPIDSKIKITVRQRHSISGDEEIGVIVTDEGIGMTEEQLSHIFERFWRGKNTQHLIGSGLGMSLVKEIMNSHRGNIQISSEPGKGTEVGLWFKTKQSKGNE